MNSGVSRKSSSSADSFEQSITQTGSNERVGRDAVDGRESGRSLPEIQCTGASKCVPVCSLQVKFRQYQAGPRSS